jgi:hypothetical protein
VCRETADKPDLFVGGLSPTDQAFMIRVSTAETNSVQGEQLLPAWDPSSVARFLLQNGRLIDLQRVY